MSVLQLGTAATDKLFLEYIKPGLNVMFVQNTIVYDRFKTDTEACQGKYGVMKLLTAGAKSARPSSSSTYPTAGQGIYAEFTFYMKRGMYATLQFDNLAIACSKGGGAVKELVKSEVDGITRHISNKLNRQFWGDGSGRLALISGAISSSTTGYVDGFNFGVDNNEYTNPSNFLDERQIIDIYSAAGVLQAEAVEISTITTGGAGSDTLVFAEAVTASDNGYIFDHDTYASSEAAGTGVPQGLISIISSSNPYIGVTASSAFQGINRSTYSYAAAQVFNMGTSAAAPAVLTTRKMLEVIQKVEKYATVDVILTNGVIWRVLAELLEVDKTISNQPAFWGGTSGLTFYGGRQKAIPIIWDDDCPDQSMYFIADKTIKVVAPSKAGMDWVPGDTGHILTKVQGKDEHTANLVWYYNMTCNLPKGNSLLRYIKHASS
jgi:hypothetical protein